MLKKTILLQSLLLLVSCGQKNQNTPDSLISSSIIIGEESRQESIHLLDVYKRRTGQLLSSTDIDGKTFYSRCTATAISQNVIITAAHCAYDKDFKPPTNLFFVPGITKNNHMPYGRFRVLRTYHPKSYDPADPLDPNKDMAIMIIGNNADNKDLFQTTGYHMVKGKSKFRKTKALTVGYPGDKPSYHQYFENDCPINDYGKSGLKIECDVFRGQSGSPIFIYSAKEEKFFIEGVISGEGTDMNYGSLITPEREKIIHSIRENNFVAENFREEWRVLEYQAPSKVKVLFKNKCIIGEKLHIATFYLNKLNEWEVTGPFVVGPGESIELIESTNIHFEVFVSNAKGKTIESGENFRKNKYGRIYPLKRYTVEGNGDYELGYNCR